METSKEIIMTIVNTLGWDYLMYGSIAAGVLGGIIGYFVGKRI